ncbi:MAG: hypothetical protein WBB50_06475 [Methyloceanibacter sp.]
MTEDGLPHLRGAMRQGPALRIAQLSPNAPRLVEGPRASDVAAPERPRFSFWRFSLRTIPIIAAVASTSVLAYFLLSERSPPHAQLQQSEAQPQVAQGGGERVVPGGGQQGVQKGSQQVAQGGPQPQPQAQPQPVQRLPMPNGELMAMMILSSVLSLNQANATGNYTVLHAMAAPGFQEANPPQRLAKIFAKLRARNLDLTPVLLFQPKLYNRPEINAQGMLRITGFFPTAPERVDFDLMFQPVQGRWRLFGIAVTTAPVKPGDAGPAPQGAPAVAPKPGVSDVPSADEPKSAKAAPPAPEPKPKPKAKVNEAPDEPVASSSDVDVRDRLDHPAAPPVAEKPKPKGVWNPFGR